MLETILALELTAFVTALFFGYIRYFSKNSNGSKAE